MRLLSLLSRAAAKPTLAIATVVLLAFGSPARAVDAIGLYVGGAIGQGRVESDAGDPNLGKFKENHSAYKVLAGIHPIPGFGVEAEYVNFGHPTGTLAAGAPADVKMNAAAAFAVWTLPIPVIDVFLKGGLARVQSTAKGVDPFATCLIAPCTNGLFELNRTKTSLALGGGVQFKAGSWAVRGEYERFEAAGGHPTLFSVGVTWTFL